jgi:hypothetical protein
MDGMRGSYILTFMVAATAKMVTNVFNKIRLIFEITIYSGPLPPSGWPPPGWSVTIGQWEILLPHRDY